MLHQVILFHSLFTTIGIYFWQIHFELRKWIKDNCGAEGAESNWVNIALFLFIYNQSNNAFLLKFNSSMVNNGTIRKRTRIHIFNVQTK